MTDRQPERPTWYPTYPTTELPSQPQSAPGGTSSATPPEPRTRRGRKGFAAAVLTGALVIGGAAGFGGAATWSLLEDEPTAAAPVSEPSTSSSTGSQDTPQRVASDGSVQAVAQRVLPSVVMISVEGPQGSGSGSGVILSEDGQILTNEHVASMAEGGSELTVSFNDGTIAQAEVVGTDPLTDVAVIQAEDVSGLTPISVGSSRDLVVGQEVVAIGSPFGLDATVTSGIVSALNRPVSFGQDSSGETTAYPAIQTDAAINPGNSGGPLVDLDGNLVGINSSIRSTSSGLTGESGSIGLGFAIPVDAVMPIAEQLAAGEEPTHARLGITIGNASSEQGTVGAEIMEVGDGSAAAEAGLEPGDVIVRLDDQQITSSDALVAMVRAYRPGDTVSVTFRRGGEEQTVELELGSDAQSS